MANTRAASRYAKSLLDLGIEQNKLEVLFNDMNTLNDSMSSRDLVLMIQSPIINAGKKIDILKKVFDGKLDNLTMNFIELITKKGREVMLPAMIKSFIEQYKKHNKITEVKLKTAHPLGAGVLASIKAALLQSEITDSEVDIETIVDEDIIGGFVIEVGDKLYDASVLHQLNKVKKEFNQNKYIKSF